MNIFLSFSLVDTFKSSVLSSVGSVIASHPEDPGFEFRMVYINFFSFSFQLIQNKKREIFRAIGTLKKNVENVRALHYTTWSLCLGIFRNIWLHIVRVFIGEATAG